MADSPLNNSTPVPGGKAARASGRPGRPAASDAPVHRGDVLDVERRVVKWWHPVLLLLALAVLYWIADAIGLRSVIQAVRGGTEALGAQGPLLFVVVYVVATMLWIPGSWLTLAAGAMFGSLVGVTVVVIASNISAALAFFVSRRWLRRRVAGWVSRSRRFQQLNELSERHGPATVLVVRLLNLFPFALINYGLGLTRVRFRTYFVWSFVGKLPGTVVMVVGVDAIVEALVTRDVPWLELGVVAGMSVLLALLLRTMHRRLQADDEADA